MTAPPADAWIAAATGLPAGLLASASFIAADAGQVHHPDHARIQANGLRDDPGQLALRQGRVVEQGPCAELFAAP